MFRGSIKIGTRLALIALGFLLCSTAFAVDPDERLADARLEARARALSTELRCLVCQNQSIDDSNAPLARDLRLLVRERLSAGNSDAEVMRYIVDRYGEFVLLRPPFGLHTLALWLSPLAILGAVLFGLWHRARGRQNVVGDDQSGPLSDDEEKALEKLLRTKSPQTGQPRD